MSLELDGQRRVFQRHAGILAATGAAAAVASLVVVITLASPSGTTNHPSPDTPGQVAAPKIAAAALPPPLTQTTIQAMQAQGTEVTVGAAATALGAPAVDESTAIATAALGFYFTQGKQPAEVSLASVTVTDYGKGNPDPNAPTDLKLYIEDRQAWVVVFNDVQLPVFGPYVPGPNQPTNANYYTARFFVLIDAQTGEFLRAESL
jgi:hypothetical protein